MDMNELPARLIETINQHIPSDAAWIPLAFIGATAAVGLLFMARGARLAPGLIAAVLAISGGIGGGLLPHWTPIPFWPAALLGGAAGLILGVILFRFWMAAQVAGVLVVAALAVYGTRLQQPLSTFSSQGYNATTEEVGLLPPGEIAVSEAVWYEHVQNLWAHLGQEVPSFQLSFVAIVVSTAIAGLVFATLMPRAARSFWAATLGTGLVTLAGFVLFYTRWPQALDGAGYWPLTIIGALWGISMLWNLFDVLGKRPKVASPAADAAPAST